MTISELILQLKEEKAYVDTKEDYYRKKIERSKESIAQILIWASYAHEFEVRSNTLYGVIRRLEELEEN